MNGSHVDGPSASRFPVPTRCHDRARQRRWRRVSFLYFALPFPTSFPGAGSCHMGRTGNRDDPRRTRRVSALTSGVGRGGGGQRGSCRAEAELNGRSATVAFHTIQSGPRGHSGAWHGRPRFQNPQQIITDDSMNIVLATSSVTLWMRLPDGDLVRC
jgi:hypothetical protein